VQLKVIYDFQDEWPRLVPSIAFLMLGLVGLSIFLDNRRFRLGKRKEKDSNDNRGIIVGLGLTIFGLGAAIICVNPINYFNAKNVYSSGEAKIVEGRVENFHSMPPEGHDMESFNVKAVHFEYSEAAISSYGYNKTLPNGGAIRPNLYVRITYYSQGTSNYILKLETE
jgi:hypothetical protein